MAPAATRPPLSIDGGRRPADGTVRVNECLPSPRRLERGVRGKALVAATELINRQGVEKLSIRTIAARAGIGISSMYHHFPNKEELLLQIALVGFQNLTDAIAHPRDEDPALAPFSQAARAFVTNVARHPALYELMFDQHLLARHEALREAERQAFAAFSACVAADERFPDAVADSVAVTMWTLGRGVAATALSQPDGQLSPDTRTLLGEGLAYLIDRRL